MKNKDINLDSIINSIQDVVLVLNKKGKVIFANDNIGEIGKYSKKELVGKRFTKLNMFKDDDMRTLKIAFKKVIKGEKIPEYEMEIKRKDGEKAFIHIKGAPYKTNGEVLGAVILIRDISQQKDIRNKLFESESKYKIIFNSTKDIMVQIDKKGKIVDVNKKALEIGGYELDDIKGKKINALSHIFTKKSIAKMVANFAKRMLGKEIGAYEVEGKSKNGERLVFEINAVPMITSKGKKIGELAILHDITKRKIMEEELKEKVTELERINEVMVGRELKMVELKEEIKRLKNKK